MDIELLDKDNNVVLLAQGIENPEYHFQFCLKSLIPTAVTWRSYMPGTPTVDEMMNTIRVRRDQLLAESDWTQMPDSPLTTAKKTAWKKYRQALRDLTETVDVMYPVWPTL